MEWIRIVNNAIPDGPANYSGSYTSVGNIIGIKRSLKNQSMTCYFTGCEAAAVQEGFLHM
jgi:hypothetical protein